MIYVTSPHLIPVTHRTCNLNHSSLLHPFASAKKSLKAGGSQTGLGRSESQNH